MSAASTDLERIDWAVRRLGRIRRESNFQDRAVDDALDEIGTALDSILRLLETLDGTGAFPKDPDENDLFGLGS